MQEKSHSILISRIIHILVLFSLTNCGYTLNHRLKETFDSGQKGVIVPVFTNNTEEVGVEMVFTNALIRELESHGEKTVAKRENAGLEIRGTVTEVIQKTEIFTGGGTKGERQQKPLYDYSQIPDKIGVRVNLLIEVWDVAQNKMRWQSKFSQYRQVSAPLSRVSDRDAPSSLGLITQSIIDSSYPAIARDIMRDMYDQMIDL